MKENKILCFDNLIEEVINKDLCKRCGGCVSFCSANGISALEIGPDGIPRYADKDKCLQGGICYLICPKTIELEDEVKDKYNWRYPMGDWKDIFSARSTDDEVRDVATDGGVVSSLLIFMLENNIVDGAIVSKRVGAHGRKPVIARTRAEVIDAAGSIFSEAQHLDELGDTYASCFPVIKVIKESASEELKKLVLVGTPCQIKSIRKMQALCCRNNRFVLYAMFHCRRSC
ncbi:MAG: hypothetical protein K8S23_08730 [Candidatus Cloacimonetes bacterium]|nr:hypothetical protein [Candidatus Cloacimonadota bacterium]